MQTNLQVDFSYSLENLDSHSFRQMKQLAESINDEPGIVWKIWTQAPNENKIGGIYLFANKAYAESYLEIHINRLKEFGINDARGIIFDINEPLSYINKAPIFQQ